MTPRWLTPVVVGAWLACIGATALLEPRVLLMPLLVIGLAFTAPVLGPLLQALVILRAIYWVCGKLPAWPPYPSDPWPR